MIPLRDRRRRFDRPRAPECPTRRRRRNEVSSGGVAFRVERRLNTSPPLLKSNFRLFAHTRRETSSFPSAPGESQTQHTIVIEPPAPKKRNADSAEQGKIGRWGPKRLAEIPIRSRRSDRACGDELPRIRSPYEIFDLTHSNRVCQVNVVVLIGNSDKVKRRRRFVAHQRLVLAREEGKRATEGVFLSSPNRLFPR